ncbi:thioredoxin family protein [Paraglaciecola aquimarina]|uniref:Thioredoxin family protein n=1 Tax=Paraglaciecola algarum TaxID=3050085 RepID=A0ABS9D5C2_9ALTE|nr:thioredoxin family protein [Paraglaciecola sp. G1-23]MCF2947642.1 thioredoxin family protein [Paraglaciecola sp. G1-23]
MYRILCCFFVIFSAGCTSTEENKIEPAVGQISIQELFIDYPVFKQSYQSYQPSQRELSLAKHLTGKSLVVLFGTWCHDSEREIPRLLKLLDEAEIELSSLTLRALNYSKQDPAGMHHKYNLEFTPTIILLDGEKELGRIVEVPRLSLGEDLAAFVRTTKNEPSK